MNGQPTGSKSRLQVNLWLGQCFFWQLHISHLLTCFMAPFLSRDAVIKMIMYKDCGYNPLTIIITFNPRAYVKKVFHLLNSYSTLAYFIHACFGWKSINCRCVPSFSRQKLLPIKFDQLWLQLRLNEVISTRDGCRIWYFYWYPLNSVVTTEYWFT